MRRTITLAWLAIAAGIGAVGCGQKDAGGTTGAPPEGVTATATAKPTATATATAAPVPTVSASADAPAASAGGKTYDCGAKGQKPCPMQGWMKRVMAGASSSGDGKKLGEALDFVAAHPPPGFNGWAALASGGAAKAKAGDIDGAKLSCKACHDQFKEKFKTSMRDMAWGS